MSGASSGDAALALCRRHALADALLRVRRCTADADSSADACAAAYGLNNAVARASIRGHADRALLAEEVKGLAKAVFVAAKYPLAQQVYRVAESLNPSDPTIQSNIAACCFNLLDYSGAESSCTNALTLAAKTVGGPLASPPFFIGKVLRRRARALLNLDMFDEAESCIQEACDLQPDEGDNEVVRDALNMAIAAQAKSAAAAAAPAASSASDCQSAACDSDSMPTLCDSSDGVETVRIRANRAAPWKTAYDPSDNDSLPDLQSDDQSGPEIVSSGEDNGAEISDFHWPHATPNNFDARAGTGAAGIDIDCDSMPDLADSDDQDGEGSASDETSYAADDEDGFNDNYDVVGDGPRTCGNPACTNCLAGAASRAFKSHSSPATDPASVAAPTGFSPGFLGVGLASHATGAGIRVRAVGNKSIVASSRPGTAQPATNRTKQPPAKSPIEDDDCPSLAESEPDASSDDERDYKTPSGQALFPIGEFYEQDNASTYIVWLVVQPTAVADSCEKCLYGDGCCVRLGFVAVLFGEQPRGEQGGLYE
jgi:tetratricopeptide (TPR) repeat protein